MNKKRILILTNRVPYPLNDGGNLAMNAMIDGYHEAGLEVYVLCMNTSRHPVPMGQLNEIYQHTSGFNAVDVDNSVHLWGVFKNFLFSRQPNHADRYRHIDYQNKILDIIGFFNPDLIQIESVFLSSYIPFIKEYSKAKLILRLHNIEYQVWQRAATALDSAIKRYYLKNLSRRIKRFEERVWQQYDLLLPITHADQQVLKDSKIKVPSIVAHFAFAAHAALAETSNATFNAYHLGAMDWIPNSESIKWFLEKVWPQIHSAIPALHFYFGGRFMPQDFMDLQIEGVTCVGEVADAQIFIADKHILIVPLKAGGGIRIKIMEAMAAAKIVVCTSIAMQGIDAVSGTHYLEANEPEEFVSALQWCLTNKDAALAMAKDAQALIINQYKRQHIMEEVLAAIEKL